MTAPVLDLAAVKATAEAATKGRWFVTSDGHSVYSAARTPSGQGILGSLFRFGSTLKECADAKHIATMDPSTTLALIDRLEQAEREVERLRGVLAGVEALGRNWLRLSGAAMTEEVREWTAASGRSVLERIGVPS